jgi:hypothetical protein
VARILPFFPINSTNFSASRNESVLLEMVGRTQERGLQTERIISMRTYPIDNKLNNLRSRRPGFQDVPVNVCASGRVNGQVSRIAS